MTFCVHLVHFSGFGIMYQKYLATLMEIYKTGTCGPPRPARLSPCCRFRRESMLRNFRELIWPFRALRIFSESKGDRIMAGDTEPGTDVMIFKIFSPKNLAKKWRFLMKTKPNFEKIDHNIGF
jgi:hypothetical protein